MGIKRTLTPEVIAISSQQQAHSSAGTEMVLLSLLCVPSGWELSLNYHHLLMEPTHLCGEGRGQTQPARTHSFLSPCN